MAPPIKHKTAAAKLKASREKCSRYYARCRESILAKRREKYHAAKKHQEDEDGKDGSDDDHEESLETLAECIAVVKYAKDDFVQYIQRSPQTFTIGVFAEYTKSIPDAPGSHGDREIFQRAISSIEEFLARGTRGQDGILQLCGVCDEWRAADQVCRSMKDTIAMVEDIYCHALRDGDGELAVVHLLGGFLYQNYR